MKKAEETNEYGDNIYEAEEIEEICEYCGRGGKYISIDSMLGLVCMACYEESTKYSTLKYP